MADVQTSLPWATIKDDLKTYLGIPLLDTSQDFNLELLWAGVTAYIDTYLNNPFVDDDGVDIPIPDAVKTAAFEMMRQVLLAFDRAPGLTEVKTGDLTEKYGGDLDAADFESAARNVKPMMWRFRTRLDL